MAASPLTHPHITKEAVKEPVRHFRAGRPDQDEAVEALEQEFAAYTGARHAVAVSSGTAALHLALLAHGIGAEDYVITSPLCIPAVASAIVATGATPLCVDINPYTYTLAPLAVEKELARCAGVPGSAPQCGAVLGSPASREFCVARSAFCGQESEANHASATAAGQSPESSVTNQLRTQNSELRTRRLAALVAVDLFGQPCEMDALADIARRHNLALIEVAWDALGGRYDGAHVGGFGTTCYSFQHGMAIDTGEGGMLTTDDEAVAGMARRLANYGCDCCGKVREPGFNYRMSGIIASLAREQLPYVDSELELRRHWARELSDQLRNLRGLLQPVLLPGARHTYQQFAIRVTPEFGLRPEEFCRRLQQQGIQAVHSPLLPLHHHPCFAGGDAAASLPNVERVAQELVLLPLDQCLDGPAIERLIIAIHGIAGASGMR